MFFLKKNNDVQGIEVGGKLNEKSIQKWGQDGKAAWHRFFLMDFGGFWKQVGKENRAKIRQDRTRQSKTGQDKTRQRQRQEKTRLWQTKTERGAFAQGGGGTQILGGYCVESPPLT